MAQRPILALDVSALVNRPITGIQRVILETVPRLCQSAFRQGYAVTLVHSLGARARQICSWSQPVADEVVRYALAEISNGRYVMMLPRAMSGLTSYFLDRLGFRNTLKRNYHTHHAMRQVRDLVYDCLSVFNTPLKRADRFLAFATGVLPIRLPEELEARHTVLILHDLIPLYHREFIPPHFSHAFGDNLFKLIYPHETAPPAAGQQRCPPDYRLVTASQNVAGEIRDLFWNLARQRVQVRVLRWGFERSKFFPDPDATFRAQLGVPADAQLVVAVSQRDPRKRFAQIERAVSLLGRHQPVYGVFIGDGHAGANQRIRYLGKVEDDVLRRALSSSDVVVNWSAAEGFGLPVIEALACGARVIVPPDNPVLHEINEPGVIVAKKPSARALARAIHQELLTRDGAAQPPDLSHFCWDASCQVLEEELGLGTAVTPRLHLTPSVPARPRNSPYN